MLQPKRVAPPKLVASCTWRGLSAWQLDSQLTRNRTSAVLQCVNKHRHAQGTQQVPYLVIASGELPAKIAGILRQPLPQMHPKAIS